MSVPCQVDVFNLFKALISGIVHAGYSHDEVTDLNETAVNTTKQNDDRKIL